MVLEPRLRWASANTLEQRPCVRCRPRALFSRGDDDAGKGVATFITAQSGAPEGCAGLVRRRCHRSQRRSGWCARTARCATANPMSQDEPRRSRHPAPAGSPAHFPAGTAHRRPPYLLLAAGAIAPAAGGDIPAVGRATAAEVDTQAAARAMAFGPDKLPALDKAASVEP